MPQRAADDKPNSGWAVSFPSDRTHSSFFTLDDFAFDADPGPCDISCGACLLCRCHNLFAGWSATDSAAHAFDAFPNQEPVVQS